MLNTPVWRYKNKAAVVIPANRTQHDPAVIRLIEFARFSTMGYSF